MASELQEGRVGVSSSVTNVIATESVLLEAGAAGGVGTGVQLMAHNGSSMLLSSDATTTVSAVDSVGVESVSVSATAESLKLASTTVDVSSEGVSVRGAGSVSVAGNEAAVRGSRVVVEGTVSEAEGTAVTLQGAALAVSASDSVTVGAGGADGATVSLYASSSTEGGEEKVRVSGGTVAVSSVGSTEVSSRLVSLESTDSIVRASSGLELEGGAVSVSGAAGMVVSTGPEAAGGLVLMTDAKSEGTVDLRGSGGVRVASESARVQVVGGGVEIAGVASELQKGRVGVSS